MTAAPIPAAAPDAPVCDDELSGYLTGQIGRVLDGLVGSAGGHRPDPRHPGGHPPGA